MRNIVWNCFVNVAQHKSSAVNHLWTNQVVLASMEYEYIIYLNPFQHIYIAILQSSKPITKKAAVLASPVIRLYSNPKCWTILSSSPWECCMLCRIFCSSFTTSSSVTVSVCRLLSADSHSRPFLLSSTGPLCVKAHQRGEAGWGHTWTLRQFCCLDPIRF